MFANFIYLGGLIGGIILGALIQSSIDNIKIDIAYHRGNLKGWEDRDRWGRVLDDPKIKEK